MTSPTAALSADVTMLSTPGGRSVSSTAIFPIAVALHGVSGAGFNTTVFPAASAGTDLRQVQHEREVPRRDQTGDADRLVEDAPGAAHAHELVDTEVALPLERVDAGRCRTGMSSMVESSWTA